jgi:hypothetical protein
MKEETKEIIKEDLFHKNGRECGQGCEDEGCLGCKWCGGGKFGLIACMKGSEKQIWILGEK